MRGTSPDSVCLMLETALQSFRKNVQGGADGESRPKVGTPRNGSGGAKLKSKLVTDPVRLAVASHHLGVTSLSQTLTDDFSLCSTSFYLSASVGDGSRTVRLWEGELTLL